MEMNQAIIAALAKVREEVKANCKCGGSGKFECGHPAKCQTIEGCDHCIGNKCKLEEIVKYSTVRKCPDCAEVRALDLGPHEFAEKYEKEIPLYEWASRETFHFVKCSCGRDFHSQAWQNHIKETNPDLTTHMHGSKLYIVHVMQVLGMWESFAINLRIKIAEEYNPVKDEPNEISKGKQQVQYADILTDGELLVPAIEVYLKEREG